MSPEIWVREYVVRFSLQGVIYGGEQNFLDQLGRVSPVPILLGGRHPASTMSTTIALRYQHLSGADLP